MFFKYSGQIPTEGFHLVRSLTEQTASFCNGSEPDRATSPCHKDHFVILMRILLSNAKILSAQQCIMQGFSHGTITIAKPIVKATKSSCCLPFGTLLWHM